MSNRTLMAADSYSAWENQAIARDNATTNNFFNSLRMRQQQEAEANALADRQRGRIFEAMVQSRNLVDRDRQFDFQVANAAREDALNRERLDLARQDNMWQRDFRNRELEAKAKPDTRTFVEIFRAVRDGEMDPDEASQLIPERAAAFQGAAQFSQDTAKREYNAADRFAADLNRNEELKARKEKAMTDLAGAWFWQRKEPNRTLSETSGSLKSSDDWLKEVRRRDPSLDSLVTKDESSGKWIVDMPNPRPKAASPSTNMAPASTAGATRNWLQEAAATNSPASRPAMSREDARTAYARLRDAGMSHEQAKASLLGSGAPSGVNAPIPSTRSGLNPQQLLYLDLRRQGASHESALAAAKAAPATSDSKSRFRELVRSGMAPEEAFESATAGNWR